MGKTTPFLILLLLFGNPAWGDDAQKPAAVDAMKQGVADAQEALNKKTQEMIKKGEEKVYEKSPKELAKDMLEHMKLQEQLAQNKAALADAVKGLKAAKAGDGAAERVPAPKAGGENVPAPKPGGENVPAPKAVGETLPDPKPPEVGVEKPGPEGVKGFGSGEGGGTGQYQPPGQGKDEIAGGDHGHDHGDGDHDHGEGTGGGEGNWTQWMSGIDHTQPNSPGYSVRYDPANKIRHKKWNSGGEEYTGYSGGANPLTDTLYPEVLTAEQLRKIPRRRR